MSLDETVIVPPVTPASGTVAARGARPPVKIKHWGRPGEVPRPRPPLTTTKPRPPGLMTRFRKKFEPRPVIDYLDIDEHCRHWTQRHYMFVVLKVFEAAAVMIAAGVVSWKLIDIAFGVWQLQALIWLGAVLHIGRFGWQVLQWRVELIIITNRKMVHAQHVLRPVVTSPTLHQVKVNYSQSLCGRWFDYGTLRVMSVGMQTEMIISFVPDPVLVFRLLSSGRND